MFQCLNVSQFIYPSSEGRYVGCFEVVAMRNTVTLHVRVPDFCVDPSFRLLWGNTEEEDWQTVWKEPVWFPSKRPNCATELLYRFALPPAENEGACWCSSPSAVGVVQGVDFGHANRCAVACHYCFNLHVPDER